MAFVSNLNVSVVALLISAVSIIVSGCSDAEREALLEFKSQLRDQMGRLSSWEGEACCRWKGVSCSRSTNRIVKLDLRNENPLLMNVSAFFTGNPWALTGRLDLSLVALSELEHLDLSFNNFNLTAIPEFLGSFEKLRYLNLSSAMFGGRVPPQLGNLSSLRVLDLGDNSFLPVSTMNAGGEIGWLAGLREARYIDLSWIDLSAAGESWLHAANMLPSLQALVLHACGLSSIPANLTSFENLTADLVSLDLGFNSFDSRLPDWIWKLSRLVDLDLRSSGFRGVVPQALENLTSLEQLFLGGNSLDPFVGNFSLNNLHGLTNLDLTGFGFGGDVSKLLLDLLAESCLKNMEVLELGANELTGNLSGWTGTMTALTYLDLGNNYLHGSLPESMGDLSDKLTFLNLSFNSFEGVLNQTHFANLPELKTLNLAYNNNLTFAVENESWIPPFQLIGLSLRYCRLGPRFPPWLRWQENLLWLDISNSGIVDGMPDWFWRNTASSQLLLLDLSDNQIAGRLPETMETMPMTMMDFSSNRFEGPVPDQLPLTTIALDLSNNFFSGQLPISLGTQPFIISLSVANNLINGGVPPSICGIQYYLDLSDNQLTGELPDCLGGTNLTVLSLANNRLSGEVPNSLCFRPDLRSLQLSNNSFDGGLSSIMKCTGLVFLDLGQNAFAGEIPQWIGEELTSLVILRLRSNAFSGELPPNLSQLRHLQLFDLADNRLTGSIPPSFGSFEAMASLVQDVPPDMLSFILSSKIPFFFSYSQSLSVIFKGETLAYSNILYLVKSMDLSCNDLNGEIPEEIGMLQGLIALNLSRNHLDGEIPAEIEGFQCLESLDLAFNDLSGEIPQTISRLTSLSHLNLSYNNLSGVIPSGDQLQTLDDPSIYVGNPGLCGPSIAKICSGSNTGGGGGNSSEAGEEDNALRWLYFGVSAGFAVGLWVAFGVLMFNKNWREPIFRISDRMHSTCFPPAAVVDCDDL